MKQLLLDIVNSIVDNPDKVKLDEDTDVEGNINFTLTVAPEDMGKIIGKEGKVIKSIRNIIRIPAIKQNKKVNLELTEQERVQRPEGEETLSESITSETTSNEEKPSETTEEQPQEEIKEEAEENTLTGDEEKEKK